MCDAPTDPFGLEPASVPLPMPWWGAHVVAIDSRCRIALPERWDASGDFFLAWIPESDHLSCWPRATHAVRVAQIAQADLSRYDAQTAAELRAEADSRMVSRVEFDGDPSGTALLEVTPPMAQALCPRLPGQVVALGMEDHFELWNQPAFQRYVESIDLTPYCE